VKPVELVAHCQNVVVSYCWLGLTNTPKLLENQVILLTGLAAKRAKQQSDGEPEAHSPNPANLLINFK
jgi:hypothetical protein